MILFICIGLFFGQILPSGFTTLKEFTDYAQRMPEYPENDTTDWINPNYSSFHKHMVPTFKQRLINLLRLKSESIFPVQDLVSLLDDVSQELQKTVPEGRVVKKVTVDVGGSFIIWGELNGAFHSLVRALNELERQGIIDNDLRIIKPLAHFVFAGDVPIRSPYLIETLFLILRLMKVNPICEGRNHEKVFFLKGKQEDRQEWLESGFGKELKVRLGKEGEEKVPLVTELSNFFNRLPLALYLMQEGQTSKAREAVRISYFGPDYNELEENAFLYFFDDYSKPVVSISQKTYQETDISLKVRAYIYAGSDIKKRIDRRGLSLISKKEARTEWAVFSSPTASSRRLYQFFDDAFVRLDVKDTLSKWTLTLFRQDVRTLNGFTAERPVYLISGDVIPDERQKKVAELNKTLADLLSDNQSLKKKCILAQGRDQVAAVHKVEKTDKPINVLQNGNIVIGSTMDLSKQLKAYSESLKQGLNLVIDKVNESGGIGGKKVQMVYLDDGYDTKKARENIERLLSDFKTDVVLSTMGTPVAAAYVDLVKDKKVLGIFPHTGSYHLPDLKYMVHLRTSYQDNGHMIAQYMAKNLVGKKIAFFYQNDVWGKDLLEGAKYEFTKAGATQFLDLPYVPNSLDLKKQAEEIKDFDPDAIAFFGVPRINQELIKLIGVDFLSKKTLFGDTILGLQEFNDFLIERGLGGMVRVEVVPNPKLSQLEIVKEFRDAAKKVGAPIDIISLEGYMNAAVFVDILEKIKDDISIDNFIKAIESIKNYNFKGLKLNFDPATRQLLHTVWINDGSDTDWPEQQVVTDKLQPEDQISKVTSKDDLTPSEQPKEALTQEEAEALKIQKKAQESLKSEDSTLTSLQNNILKIGSTMDFSKGVKGLSDGYKGGMMLKLDEINAAGGINGINFQLNVMDDMYEPQRARVNVLEMMKNSNIDLLIAPLGTPTTKAYLDLIEQGKVLALFPIARSAKFRRPDLINIIQYQMSLKQETEIITRYVYHEFKPKKIVIFYQNDDFGIEPKEEIERLAKSEMSSLELLPVLYERNNVNFKEQIAKIKNFKPDAVALQATSSVVEEFVRQIGADFLYGKILFGGSWLMVDQFLKSMREKGLDVNLISSVPDPEKSEIQLAQEFRKIAKEKDIPFNVIYFEGYLYMSLLAYAMKQIEAPYSKEKIINVFQGMKNLDFKGLKLNFNPETRVILKDAWIYSTRKNEWVSRSVSDAKEGPTEKSIAPNAQVIKKPDEEPITKQPEKDKQLPAKQESDAVSPAKETNRKASEAAKKAEEALKEINQMHLSSLQGNVLKIGSTMDLSKGWKGLSEDYKNGMMLKLNEVNSAGGVQGISLQLNVADDSYEATIARKNVEEMLNAKIDLLLVPFGTLTTKAYLDLVESGKLLVLFPVARTNEYRRPDLINMIHYQPSLQQEVVLMTHYILSEHKVDKLVVLYESDPYWQEPQHMIENFLKRNYPDVAHMSVVLDRKTLDLEKQIKKIQEFKPNAIALHATAPGVEEFVRQIGPDFLYDKRLYGGTWLMNDRLLKSMKEKGLNMATLSLVPDPEESEILLAQEFRKAAQKDDMHMNAIVFEGYMYMSLLADALKRIESPLTKEKIINFFQNMKNVDFKGIQLNFNPENRTLVKDIWVYETKDNSRKKRSIEEVEALMSSLKAISESPEKNVTVPEQKVPKIVVESPAKEKKPGTGEKVQ